MFKEVAFLNFEGSASFLFDRTEWRCHSYSHTVIIAAKKLGFGGELKYDFVQIIERRGTDGNKWAEVWCQRDSPMGRRHGLYLCRLTENKDQPVGKSEPLSTGTVSPAAGFHGNYETLYHSLRRTVSTAR
jgi:hypothetical protein